MKSLIIAGGVGARLMPLTQNTPKTLVRIGQKPILGRIIDSLLENEIRDILIITGYLEEKIKKFIDHFYPGLKPIYIFSPFYKNSKIRYIHPIWLAREYLKNKDILYLHGDLFYNPILIKKALKFSYSGALVKRNFIPKKDFKARIERGLISEIGVDVFGKNCGFCLPLYKFLKDDFQIWMKQIGKFVRKNKLDCYAEDALNEVLNKIKLYPIYFDKECGIEIDDFEDLKEAKRITKNENL